MLAVMFWFASSNVLFAASSGGRLSVTGSIAGSLALTTGEPAGNGPSGRSGAPGAVSRLLSAPRGFRVTEGAMGRTYTSNLDVTVVKANTTSADYTVTAQLGNLPGVGVVWNINSVVVESGASASLTSMGTYASTPSYPWTIVIQGDAAAGAPGSINVIAISN